MIECKCKFSELVRKPEFRNRIIGTFKIENEQPWLFVPQNPAIFGHVVVACGKCYVDISDCRLLEDQQQLKEIGTTIVNLSCRMRKSLTLEGKKCEKVYVTSQCETPGFHLHFHIIPRFERQNKGNLFLFEREMEEARWMLVDEREDKKIHDGKKRISDAETILETQRKLLSSGKWLEPNAKRKEYVEKIKVEIERILGIGRKRAESEML